MCTLREDERYVEHCNKLCNKYRAGLIDLDTIFACSSTGVSLMWAKFRLIIDVYRESSFSREHHKDFEYLTSELAFFQCYAHQA